MSTRWWSGHQSSYQSTTTTSESRTSRTKEERLSSMRRDIEAAKDKMATEINPKNPLLPYLLGMSAAAFAFGGRYLADAVIRVSEAVYPHR